MEFIMLSLVVVVEYATTSSSSGVVSGIRYYIQTHGMYVIYLSPGVTSKYNSNSDSKTLLYACMYTYIQVFDRYYMIILYNIIL